MNRKTPLPLFFILSRVPADIKCIATRPATWSITTTADSYFDCLGVATYNNTLHIDEIDLDNLDNLIFLTSALNPSFIVWTILSSLDVLGYCTNYCTDSQYTFYSNGGDKRQYERSLCLLAGKPPGY